MGSLLKQEQKREEVLLHIKNFCLMDDDFMTKCFEGNTEAAELVLRIILKKPDIKVEKLIVQYSMKNIKGRSLRLDIYATDSAGKKYNIEIQRSDRGAEPKRARYNSSIIDSDILPSGFGVENLVDTYVIFITESDVLGKNKPIYHIERYIEEAEEYFNDGSHIIYVNASYRDNTELGKLMHDFWCINPDDMNYKVLADTTRYYKEDKEGIHSMCRAVEEMIDKEKKEVVLRMLKNGKLSIEEIASCVDVPLEEVKELAKLTGEGTIK